MKKIRPFIVCLSLVSAFFFFKKPVRAGEGIVELYSTTGEKYRCFAASVLMEDKQYHLLVSCRDLIYPSDAEILRYVLWSRPKSGQEPVNLGSLVYGKIEATTKSAFDELFVTKETTSKAKEPLGPIVMRGSVKPIPISSPITPTEPEVKESEAKIESEQTEKQEEKQTEEKSEEPIEGEKPKKSIQSIIEDYPFLPILGLAAAVAFMLFLIRKK